MYPAATLEVATINNENVYYSNLSATQWNKPSWFTDPMYPTNVKVAQVKNTTGVQKIGPAIVLKVMAGDSYNIRVASGWSSGSTATNSSTNVLSSLVTALTGGVAGMSGGKVSAIDLQGAGSGILSALTSFMCQQSTTGTKPKAYINWVLLNEQFQVAKDAGGNIVGAGLSGFEQVENSGVTKIHTKPGLTVNQSGYLYIYTSNEATNIEVLFDNLQVTHIRGPLLEETHYYPFGLTMAGISSKAVAILENKRKWNKGSELETKEFNDGSGLELYATLYRSLDPQLGRFWQIDPRPDNSHSLYSSMSNNPISFNDPLGDSILGKANIAVADKIVSTSKEKIVKNNINIENNNATINSKVGKLVAGALGFAKVSAKEVKKSMNSINNLKKQNSELTDLNLQLNTGISAINAMKADVKNNYSFKSPANNDGSHHVLRGIGKNVIVEGSTNGLFLHESVHILQELNSGGLRFATTGDHAGRLINVSATGSQIGDEVQSYQVQFAFDRTFSTGSARNLSDINPASVRDLHNDNGYYPYKDLK